LFLSSNFAKRIGVYLGCLKCSDYVFDLCVAVDNEYRVTIVLVINGGDDFVRSAERHAIGRRNQSETAYEPMLWAHLDLQ
jgi:hypothetical protein